MYFRKTSLTLFMAKRFVFGLKKVYVEFKWYKDEDTGNLNYSDLSDQTTDMIRKRCAPHRELWRVYFVSECKILDYIRLRRLVVEINRGLYVSDLFRISSTLGRLVPGPPSWTRSCTSLTFTDVLDPRGHIKYNQNATVCPRSIAKPCVCLNVSLFRILSRPHRYMYR